MTRLLITTSRQHRIPPPINTASRVPPACLLPPTNTASRLRPTCIPPASRLRPACAPSLTCCQVLRNSSTADVWVAAKALAEFDAKASEVSSWEGAGYRGSKSQTHSETPSVLWGGEAARVKAWGVLGKLNAHTVCDLVRSDEGERERRRGWVRSAQAPERHVPHVSNAQTRSLPVACNTAHDTPRHAQTVCERLCAAALQVTLGGSIRLKAIR